MTEKGSERHLAGLERKSQAGRQAFGARREDRPSNARARVLGPRASRLNSSGRGSAAGSPGPGAGWREAAAPSPSSRPSRHRPHLPTANTGFGRHGAFLTSSQGRRKTPTGARNLRTQERTNPAAPHFTGFPAGGSRVRKRSESRSAFRAT